MGLVGGVRENPHALGVEREQRETAFFVFGF
jgi:hypothetical protein